MNVPSHMSGQIPGQMVPNQGVSRLSGLPQQNASQFQNMGGIGGLDPDLAIARGLMREKISQYVQSRPLPNGWQQRLPEIVRRLEDVLFKHAQSKEEYLNMETFENRLMNIFKTLSNPNQHLARRFASSAPVSTMIPTPGMSHGGNSNMMDHRPADTSVTTSTPGTLLAPSIGTGNMTTTVNGAAHMGNNCSFNGSDGSNIDGYQHSSANGSVGHSSGQMIPTPGLTNVQSTPLYSGGSGGGYSGGTGGIYSGVESTAVQQPHKQFIGSQNSRILQNLGGQVGVNIRNNMQQRYGFQNGGLPHIGNSQLVNGPVASEGYLSAATYNNSPKTSQQHYDMQHHQTLRPRDNYGVNNISGSGNSYANVPTSGSTTNNQNINSLNMQNRSKPSISPQCFQQNLQSVQQTLRRPPLIDNAQKMEVQSSNSGGENYMQTPQSFSKFQHQQFQPQTSQQFVPNQFQSQQQLLVENDPFRHQLMTSINGQLISENCMDSTNESLLPQVSEQFPLSELSGFQQNTVTGNNTRVVGQLSGSQNMHPPQQKHQICHQNQHLVESQNNFNYSSSECQSELPKPGQWLSQTPQKSHVLEQTSFQHRIQNDRKSQMIGQGDGTQPQIPSEGSGLVASVSNGMNMPKQTSLNSNDLGTLRAQQYYNQRRWLLFLHHARQCRAPEGKCKEDNCMAAQDLLTHMGKCDADNCTYRLCKKTKVLLKHFIKCQNIDCPVCVHVREFSLKYKPRPLSDATRVHEKNGTWKTVNAMDVDKPGSKTSSSSIEASEDLQASKRLKMDHLLVINSKSEICPSSIQEKAKLHASQEAHMTTHPMFDSVVSTKSEATDIKIESSIHSSFEPPPTLRRCNDSEHLSSVRPSDCQDKLENMQIDKNPGQPKIEIKQDVTAPSVDPCSGTKSGKPKVKGVSLTELFTPEQVKQHILGLRQWVGQSKAKAEKNQAMEHSMSENSCQLCAVEKLTFEPPPIYCSICGARIKRNAMYYTFGSSDTRQYFCIPCHNDARGDSIEVEGNMILKARLEKKRNDEETEEWWVQCDKCEAWQHQICTLFNGRRNEGGQAEYTCPNCYVQEVERGERKPLPQSAVLGADDLPKTLLSDHLEKRLHRRLKQEKQERAKLQGKSIDEIPGAEALVVRVVSSVDKKLDVKPRFLEIFQEDNYPTEFPYKSKVVLLFQKIEGVEVCLFGMYVQEFGSECQFPNQRRVYLSYLDSVKYFRPEIKTVTGEALRTFVYHEILIGYLDYCKKRGFTSCYIWACPPLKGEDYILYCHPEIQKTPKSDKLREWYLSMLRKAMKENIVADLTNLFDHFFITTGECKAKVTAARLPYFDGDYWPGAAEDMINQLQQEEDGRKQHKKGKTKKTITKRALKAAGQTDLSGNASKDALLMQKLGETISPMKEDFIMVHLQHGCTHCCLLMVSGYRWVCNQCKNFQLCEKCYDSEQKREERERHPVNSREKHFLNPVAIIDVPSDTRDRDDILESEFFDTRQAFLSLCQGNHYQYDTLRRAKHSSMMVLYHLHNPTAPAFVTTCNICRHDIETGQGWRCETCTDFDVCNSCYKKDGGIDHPHKLTTHPSMMDAQNTEARQKRVAELRKMLNLLVHASQCRVAPHRMAPYQAIECQYPDCRKVKGLFRHGRSCKVRASGGCPLCKRMWYLLQLHARACKESECHVPRCKDLKEHLRRLQQQSDSRRRAAVMEMMRQRAAEVAAKS